MAQQLINIGSSADDGTGTNWRDAWNFTNQNFTELFGVVSSIGLTFIGVESDFPVQDATTITLEAKTTYLVTAGITTAKRFIVEDGAVITALNILGEPLIYTGTGTMFTGVDASFTIREIALDHPNAQGFSFTDTLGGTFLFLNEKVRTQSGTKYGSFDNMQTVLIEGSSALSMNDGLSFSNSSQLIISIDKFFLGSTSATFKGIDFGTSQAQTIEIANFIANAPSGAFGISGLANSGNIPAGRLAMVNNSEFGGGITPLENITNEDVRWLFKGNSPIPDTIEDSLLSLNNNALETVITTINTPTKVNGVFITERESLFTSDGTGRITYVGERDTVIPVDIASTLRSASGTNKDVTMYLALNGVAIANSAKGNRVGVTDLRSISVPWQLQLSENDYLEIFVENNSDTINIVVIDAVLRAR